jgi:hypothetical protein
MVFYILYITIVNKGEITNKDSNRGKIIRVCMSFILYLTPLTSHNIIGVNCGLDLKLKG